MIVHLIGAGGIGMSGLRTFLQKSGIPFTASDDASKEPGFLPESVAPVDAKEIVVSSAIKKEHPQYVWARENGVPILHRSVYTNRLIRAPGRTVVSVSGSHGKTSSSALLAWILSKTITKASFLIGGHFGGTDICADLVLESPYFVVEADESDSSMLLLNGQISLVTNLSAEHISHYGNFENLVSEMNQFVDESENPICHISCKDLIKRRDGIRFYDASGIILHELTSAGMRFDANGRWGDWRNLKVGLVGRHMLENIAGCLEVLYTLGIDEETVRHGLTTFPGVKKRLEVLKLSNNRLVLKDYAHHPVEVDCTIAAVAEAYADRRMHILWEPHKFSRLSYENNYELFLQALTKNRGQNRDEQLAEAGNHKSNLPNAASLKSPATILLAPVWAAGETPEERFSQNHMIKDISEAAAKSGLTAACEAIFSAEDLVRWAETSFADGDVFLVMGAGGIHKVVDKVFKDK